MNYFKNLKEKIRSNNAVICVIGLGYVGSAIIEKFDQNRFKTIGIDNDPKKLKSKFNDSFYIEVKRHGDPNEFGFENFNSENFNKFLEENNLFLVYKLHPNEESHLNEYKDLINSKFSFHLNNQVLLENNFDFYEVLNCADILITDYSEIFIDYLLLNRPIIFNPTLSLFSG